MKIGIFGGSFNPPHNMHKDIALNLIKYGYVDKVIYVPTGNKYMKKDLIDDKDRYNMLNIMVKPYSYLEVSDYEMKNKLKYTYETLDYFKNKYPNDQIYFILGSDNLKEIKSWKRYNYIMKNYKLLIILRDNDNILELINNLNDYKDNLIFTKINKKIISSTSIRNNIKKHLNDIDKNIYNYILKNNLYL